MNKDDELNILQKAHKYKMFVGRLYQYHWVWGNVGQLVVPLASHQHEKNTYKQTGHLK